MTPTLTDILAGLAAAIAAPQPPEAGGAYMASRLGMVAMLALLAAQEAERGSAARIWENGAIRALFAKAAADYDRALDGRLAVAVATTPKDFSWSGLDADNAEVRRTLILLHEAAEARDDRGLDLEILRLYKAMAQARRLDPPMALG
jgi:hypothetical protein